jgi:hypothetical protein
MIYFMLFGLVVIGVAAATLIAADVCQSPDPASALPSLPGFDD